MKAVEIISWLLDGWDYLLKLWSEIKVGETNQREVADTIGEMFRLIPLPPQEIVAADRGDFWREVADTMQRRAADNMLTGVNDIDLEQLARIEARQAALT